MESKDSKLTVSGDFDPVKVVNKLRKSWHTEIKNYFWNINFGLSCTPQVANLVKAYEAYYPMPVTYYCLPPEETPSCVIC
ncbi:hypothetical protein EUGRSUZ_E00669 [Eucalyptus grandis]|uniref:Uncharacterized protein n=2 Tax=Eucalyptus grandis TaxID=71139 RepID=A0ACC3KSB2_EUCGR|nr:hypothetical protein EUGRSUZ_E00669 [Eucalyptus grandis]